MKYCMKCGKELMEGADVCVGCGTFINKVNNVIDDRKTNKFAVMGLIMSTTAPFIYYMLLVFMGFCVSLFKINFTFGAAAFLSFILFLILCGVSISFSALGMSRCRKNNEKGYGLAVGGLVIGILEACFALLILLATTLAYY